MPLNLPASAGASRELAILDHVQEGNFEIEWSRIVSDYGNHTAEFFVFSDALQVEGVRVNVSAKTQQRIADRLDCMLLTPKLADLIWEQRNVTLKPHLVRPYTTSTQGMLEHSAAIDAQLAALGHPDGLKATVGKHWVVDNALLKRPKFAMNYGWHFEGQTFQGSSFEVTASAMKTPEGRLVRLVQGRGTKHDGEFTDYSQTCTLVSLNCKVDGNDARLDELLKHPQLSYLANVDGILHVLRQPGT